MGWPGYISFFVLILILIFAFKEYRRQKRYDKLMAKYNDTNVVDKIIKNKIWQGQSLDQLRDSFGAPQDTEKKVLKTKTKETWKYNHINGNRYGTRVFIENDKVIGWEFK